LFPSTREIKAYKSAIEELDGLYFLLNMCTHLG